MGESRHDLRISREPLCDYGNLESVVRGLRDRRPLDLNAEHWRDPGPESRYG